MELKRISLQRVLLILVHAPWLITIKDLIFFRIANCLRRCWHKNRLKLFSGTADIVKIFSPTLLLYCFALMIFLEAAQVAFLQCVCWLRFTTLLSFAVLSHHLRWKNSSSPTPSAEYNAVRKHFKVQVQLVCGIKVFSMLVSSGRLWELLLNKSSLFSALVLLRWSSIKFRSNSWTFWVTLGFGKGGSGWWGCRRVERFLTSAPYT